MRSQVRIWCRFHRLTIEVTYNIIYFFFHLYFHERKNFSSTIFGVVCGDGEHTHAPTFIAAKLHLFNMSQWEGALKEVFSKFRSS